MRTVVLTTLLLLALPGCGDDRDDEIYVHRTEHRAHVCSRDCHQHYYDGGGKLIVIKGHRHGPECGHYWEGNRWLVVRTGGSSRAHICTRDCHHHYYDGRRTVVLKGHRHGPDCGHYWEGNRWLVVRTGSTHGHVCTRSCNHYYDGRKTVALKGHRHSPNCGHHWDGRRWIRATAQPQRRVIRRR